MPPRKLARLLSKLWRRIVKRRFKLRKGEGDGGVKGRDVDVDVRNRWEGGGGQRLVDREDLW
jgi:hypothetical protein